MSFVHLCISQEPAYQLTVTAQRLVTTAEADNDHPIVLGPFSDCCAALTVELMTVLGGNYSSRLVCYDAKAPYTMFKRSVELGGARTATLPMIAPMTISGIPYLAYTSAGVMHIFSSDPREPPVVFDCSADRLIPSVISLRDGTVSISRYRSEGNDPTLITYDFSSQGRPFLKAPRHEASNGESFCPMLTVNLDKSPSQAMRDLSQPALMAAFREDAKAHKLMVASVGLDPEDPANHCQMRECASQPVSRMNQLISLRDGTLLLSISPDSAGLALHRVKLEPDHRRSVAGLDSIGFVHPPHTPATRLGRSVELPNGDIAIRCCIGEKFPHKKEQCTKDEVTKSPATDRIVIVQLLESPWALVERAVLPLHPDVAPNYDEAKGMLFSTDIFRLKRRALCEE